VSATWEYGFAVPLGQKLELVSQPELLDHRDTQHPLCRDIQE
jgi:hypothetical protein